MIASSATVLLGFAGLAVEAGSWYLSLRNATTAADLAAMAGAAARERGADYQAVARNTAALNGFPNANEVAVQPPASGNFTADPSAVEVVITRTQSVSLLRLFVKDPPVIHARAVASAHVEDEVCLLALGGGLDLGGHSATTTEGCMLGSNAAAPLGINVAGSAAVRTAGLITTGTCSDLCYTGDVWTDNTAKTRPLVVANRPAPITDPFAKLRDWTPSPNTSNCLSADFKSSSTVSLSPGTFCQNVSLEAGQTLNLAAGLYYFNNANLEVHGQATITGQGVTLVFTGDPGNVGTVTINAGAEGQLSGPTGTNIPGHPEAIGLIMYRDANAATSGPVRLNGNETMTLYGGLYFPSSDVEVNGKSATTSPCLAVVSRYISFSGNADTQVGVSGCKDMKPYPTMRTVRLVE